MVHLQDVPDRERTWGTVWANLREALAKKNIQDEAFTSYFLTIRNPNFWDLHQGC